MPSIPPPTRPRTIPSAAASAQSRTAVEDTPKKSPKTTAQVSTRPAAKPSRLLAFAKTLQAMLDHPDLGADEIAVLVALARYSDERGTCHPSQSTIAGQLQRSRPWVNRRLKNLASLGLLEKQRHRLPKGGETSCRYRLPTLDITTAPRSDLLSNRSVPPMSEAGRFGDTPCPAGVTMNLDPLEGKEPSLFAWAGTRAENDDAVVDQEPSTAPPDAQTNPTEPTAPTNTPIAPAALPTCTEDATSAMSVSADNAASPADWYPTPDDLSWAARTRPDIDIAHFTRKYLAKQAILDPTAGNHSHRWRLWLIDERAPRVTTARPTRPPNRIAAASRHSEAPPRHGAFLASSSSTLAPPASDSVSRAGRIAALIATRLNAPIPGTHA